MDGRQSAPMLAPIAELLVALLKPHHAPPAASRRAHAAARPRRPRRPACRGSPSRKPRGAGTSCVGRTAPRRPPGRRRSRFPPSWGSSCPPFGRLTDETIGRSRGIHPGCGVADERAALVLREQATLLQRALEPLACAVQ